jgi:hypothetical protein
MNIMEFAQYVIKKECKYSKQVICLKHNLPYENMKGHCSMDCEYFPDFKRGEFYDEKCPITVFFCPSTNQYYDPRNDSNLSGNELRSTSGHHDEFTLITLTIPMITVKTAHMQQLFCYGHTGVKLQ